ncbi:MAG: hypothetical protein CME04_18605 [Gemmatimonadaceae bacterium]|nr:hypothetical protein [Gemmatimonadaceae bacterium]
MVETTNTPQRIGRCERSHRRSLVDFPLGRTSLQFLKPSSREHVTPGIDPAVKLEHALLLFVLVACADHSGESGGIVVRDAWIREPPPRSPAAGYLVIENHGTSDAELIAVETTAAERTEIHVMEYKDDGMTMRRTDAITIPAHGEIALRSGRTHLMLMKPRRVLQSGDRIELVLHFAGDVESRVSVPVRKERYGSD